MERLTKVINAHGETVVVYTRGKYENTTAAELEYKDIRNIMRRLSEYEDTGLTPPEIMELKMQNTAESITVEEFHGVKVYSCPICNEPVHEKDNFCSKCGQRLKQED